MRPASARTLRGARGLRRQRTGLCGGAAPPNGGGCFVCRPLDEPSNLQARGYAGNSQRTSLRSFNSSQDDEMSRRNLSSFERKLDGIDLTNPEPELTSLLQAWLTSWKSDNIEGLPSPEEMLRWIDERKIVPPMAAFHILLDGAVAVNKKQGPEGIIPFVEELLSRMLKAADALPSDQTPNQDLTFAVHKIMTLYCSADNIQAAEHLLYGLERLHDSGKELIFPLYSDTYTIVISSWAKRKCPREAEYVLNHMLNRIRRVASKGRGYVVAPTKDNFESCLSSWAAAAQKVSGERAENLLLKMQELADTNVADTSPSVLSFLKAVIAWVKSRNKKAIGRSTALIDAMESAEWSVDERQSPVFQKALIDAYLEVMKLLALMQSRAGPSQYAHLLRRLETSVGRVNMNTKMMQKFRAAQIMLWANSGRKDIAVQTNRILAEMERARKLGSSSNDPFPFWNREVCMALLRAFAKGGDGKSAQMLLHTMLQDFLRLGGDAEGDGGDNDELPPKPDIKCFELVLLAWSKSKDEDARARAEKLFLQMVDMQKSGHLELSVTSYNAVLSALAGTHDAAMAARGEGYLRQLRHDEAFDPTAVTYTAAAGLWANVKHPLALDRTQLVINQMLRDGLQPERKTYVALVAVLRNSNLPKHVRGRLMFEAEAKIAKITRRR